MLGNEAGALLELSGIDQNLRAEEVSVKDWCLLSKVCFQQLIIHSNRLFDSVLLISLFIIDFVFIILGFQAFQVLSKCLDNFKWRET